MKTIQEWLTKIENLHPDTMKLGLDRVAQVATRLQVTDFDCPVVTIGGTNGKGSCVKFLESILYSASYRVGAYTSPHLLAFNERIRINHNNVQDSELIIAFEVIEEARQGIPLTFFEFTTLAALWLFKEAKLDVLLLEVGLGGRLDAVNIVDSDIAIITSIDFDHMNWLGNTRDEIALEKAGIFRPESKVICGDLDIPDSVQKYAKKLNCRLYCRPEDFNFEVYENNWSWTGGHEHLVNLPTPALPVENAATALMATALLHEFLDISYYAILNGLKIARLPGRFQVFHAPNPCILDVAHNPASARMLAQLLEDKAPNENFIAVVGMLEDKDIANTLKPLISRVDCWYFGDLNISRGAAASHVAKQLQEFSDLKCYTYHSVQAAFLAATHHYPRKRILVFGSFYTVAEVLLSIENKQVSSFADQVKVVEVAEEEFL